MLQKLILSICDQLLVNTMVGVGKPFANKEAFLNQASKYIVEATKDPITKARKAAQKVGYAITFVVAQL